MTEKSTKHLKPIILSVNTFWNAFNFRFSLIEALITDGHHVILLAKEDEYMDKFCFSGCTPVSLNFSTNKITPFGDINLIYQYAKIFFKFKPCFFLAFTIKPNIYGSIAAKIFRIPTINNMAGLCRAFNSGSFLKTIAIILYKSSLSRSIKIFFQNTEDRELLLAPKVVNIKYTEVLPGSGVDLKKFKNSFDIIFPNVANKDESKLRQKILKCESDSDASFSFMLISRLLKQKGVEEYVEAAKLLKQEKKDVEFFVLGLIDPNDNNSISKEYLDKQEAQGVIKFLGGTDDVRKYIFFADCIVLPTYYNEGRPKILLEAGSMETPVIATDWVGCRDIVSHEHNGLLCKPKDCFDLKKKMVDMLVLGAESRKEMGINGRQVVEKDYSDRYVIKFYQDIISNHQ